MCRYRQGAFEPPAAFLLGIVQFVRVSIGSVLVGVLVAAPSALLLKHTDLTNHESFELSLLLLLGYCAYPTAEAMGCSGILGLFVCATLMGHYHVHSLTPAARAAAELTLRSIAHLTETFVFMYMGLDLVAQRGAVDDLFDDSDLGARGVDEAASTRRFVAFAVVVVPLSRVVVIPPLVALANLWRGRKRARRRRACRCAARCQARDLLLARPLFCPADATPTSFHPHASLAPPAAAPRVPQARSRAARPSSWSLLDCEAPSPTPSPAPPHRTTSGRLSRRRRA